MKQEALLLNALSEVCPIDVYLYPPMFDALVYAATVALKLGAFEYHSGQNIVIFAEHLHSHLVNKMRNWWTFL